MNVRLYSTNTDYEVRLGHPNTGMLLGYGESEEEAIDEAFAYCLGILQDVQRLNRKDALPKSEAETREERMTRLREAALEIEARADAQPDCKKGSIVFAKKPSRPALPKVKKVEPMQCPWCPSHEIDGHRTTISRDITWFGRVDIPICWVTCLTCGSKGPWSRDKETAIREWNGMVEYISAGGLSNDTEAWFWSPTEDMDHWYHAGSTKEEAIAYAKKHIADSTDGTTEAWVAKGTPVQPDDLIHRDVVDLLYDYMRENPKFGMEFSEEFEGVVSLSPDAEKNLIDGLRGWAQDNLKVNWHNIGEPEKVA